MSRTLYSRPAVEVSTTHMDELMVRGCGGVSACGVVTSRRRRGATTFTRDSGGVCDRALARSRDGGGWITIVVVVVVVVVMCVVIVCVVVRVRARCVARRRVVS